MELVKAFTFTSKEDNWIVKIIIGGVIAFFSFLLIPIFFLYGYQLAVTRNVMNGEEHPLPEWTDWGQLFVEGAILWVAQLIYALPLVLLSVCYWPILAIGMDSSGNLEPVGIGLVSVFGCLMVLYGILLAFIVPALFIQYARSGEFGGMFRFGEVFALVRRNVADILLAILATIVAGIVLGIVIVISIITICGPLIVPYLGTAWLTIANGHLYGQIAARDKAKMAGAYAG